MKPDGLNTLVEIAKEKKITFFMACDSLDEMRCPRRSMMERLCKLHSIATEDLLLLSFQWQLLTDSPEYILFTTSTLDENELYTMTDSLILKLT